MPRLRFSLSLSIACFLACTSLALGAEGYGLGPKPAWVIPAPFLDKGRRQAIDGEFARFFISDTQINLAPLVQRYHHYAARALNAQGIQQLSKLTLTFDPRTEKLDVHDLSLLREGKRIPLLRSARVSVSSPDSATRQVIFLLDQLKIDDVLDYQYTLTALQKSDSKYAASFKLRWPVPVDRVQVRLLSPVTRTLDYRVFNLQQMPLRKRVGANNEIALLLDNVPPQHEEPNTPAALVGDVQMQISEYASWDEVQAQLSNQYRNQTSLPPALEKLVAQWQGQPSQDAAVAALDYVQRDIANRSGGITQPALSLEQIVAQQAGNARDKAQLLLALLARLKIEAYPALVSSTRHPEMPAPLPAPEVFDHVLVLAYLDGAPYWLDPMRRHQAGDLAARSATKYRSALVLDDSVGGMIEMEHPLGTLPHIAVRQQFRVTDYRAPVALEMQTEYRGVYAEGARALLARQGLKPLTQARAQQMTRFYPRVEVAGVGQWDDDQQRNIVLVTERYTIPDFFDYADGYFVSKYFVSQEALPLLKLAEPPTRTMPFALAPPFEFHQATELTLPTPVAEMPLERRSIDNLHIAFLTTRVQQDKQVKFDYLIQGRKEWVLPALLAQYQADVQSIRANLSQTLVLTVAAPAEIQRIYAAYPAVAAGTLDPEKFGLYQDAARIQAAIESGLLSELQRQRALRQFNALRTQLDLPPREAEAASR